MIVKTFVAFLSDEILVHTSSDKLQMFATPGEGIKGGGQGYKIRQTYSSFPI